MLCSARPDRLSSAASVGIGRVARDRHGARRAVELDRAGQRVERHQLVAVADGGEGMPRAQRAQAAGAGHEVLQLLERLRAMQGPGAVGVVARPVGSDVRGGHLGESSQLWARGPGLSQRK